MQVAAQGTVSKLTHDEVLKTRRRQSNTPNYACDMGTLETTLTAFNKAADSATGSNMGLAAKYGQKFRNCNNCNNKPARDCRLLLLLMMRSALCLATVACC